MQSLYAIDHTAKQMKVFNALAAVLGLSRRGWLRVVLAHRWAAKDLLGFALIWLLVAGVYIRVYAQFLRWWHQVDY